MTTKIKQKDTFTKENKKKVETLLESYFTYLKNQYDQNKLEQVEQCEALFLLSSAYPNFENLEEWEEIGYKLCWEIKNYLEASAPNFLGVGMVGSGGIGYLAFFVNLYKEKTGNLGGFSRSLNKLLLDVAYQYSQTYSQYKEGTKTSHYDVIQGISGVVYYLLDFDWAQEDAEKLKAMLRYLASLTDSYQYKGKEVMKFHVQKENLFLDVEKEVYPDGIYDFGIAHGMVGPLLALCKAKAKGIMGTQSEGATKKIWEMYETFVDIEDGIALWPAKLDYHDYIKGILTLEHTNHGRASWCYGNLGITRALQLAARYQGNKTKERLYGGYLKDIIVQPTKEYQLDNFCLCHGYASVLAIASYYYEETLDQEVAEKINEIVENFFIQVDNKFSSYDNIFEEKEFQTMFYDEQLGFVQGFLEDFQGFILTLIHLRGPQPALGQLLLIQ